MKHFWVDKMMMVAAEASLVLTVYELSEIKRLRWLMKSAPRAPLLNHPTRIPALPPCVHSWSTSSPTMSRDFLLNVPNHLILAPGLKLLVSFFQTRFLQSFSPVKELPH